MNQDAVDNAVTRMIRKACADLDYTELVTLDLAMAMGGIEPQHLGYDKVKMLLTENKGTEMHADTARLFRQVIGGMIKEQS